MTKVDVLDDVIEMLIKKAMDEQQQSLNINPKSYKPIIRGENFNGIYSSSGNGK